MTSTLAYTSMHYTGGYWTTRIEDDVQTKSTGVQKLQHSMASNQLTGFESLSMDVITSSGLCACSF